MIGILRNKNLTTRFQILIEIADSGPNIQQRDIAKKLDITPQAVSDYIAQMAKEGLLIPEGRARYKITNEGVNWIIKQLRELRDYNAFIERAVTNIATCAAIADDNLVKGQAVGLKMKEGLLFASEKVSDGARGIAFSDAKPGEDVGVSNIEGIVDLQIGEVMILKLPGIQKGGSRKIDYQQLKTEISGKKLIGAIGLEAIAALKKVYTEPVYVYGVTEAVIEAARSGLYPVVVCVEDAASGLIRRLEEENVDYELIDLGRSRERTKT